MFEIFIITFHDQLCTSQTQSVPF